MNLEWLPPMHDWKGALAEARMLSPVEAVPRLLQLANCSIDFIQTTKLDRILQNLGDAAAAQLNRTAPVKLAVLGSSTLSHLSAPIRIGAARRGFRIEVFEGTYDMYRQEVSGLSPALNAFQPDVVLLAFAAHHLVSGDAPTAERALETVQFCWRMIQQNFKALIIQQTVLPVFQPLVGNNEHIYRQSPFTIVHNINQKLRACAIDEGIHLLSVDTLAQADGVTQWFEPALWHRSKQEVHPSISPLYGDHVARIVAAARGLSSKCLVLDLDNTLWGGVIGDDGLHGIVLGQGHALGEAFTSFQRYVRSLASRGIILAVCSKNEDVHARAAFTSHPEMVLCLGDISCFVANWQDKASNLRSIAATLNIGLDSLVFVDDNPFERNLIRQELPMVAVPELPEDPALYERTLAAAGYFETLAITHEDSERVRLYADRMHRERARFEATDITSYLRSLNMVLESSPFDLVGLTRITQLINKSNQFNLTTARYTEDEVAQLIEDPSVLTLQVRLRDVYGDNGMIAVVIGKIIGPRTLELTTWLMSCRVLGRQVEEATLNLIVENARALGIEEVRGIYIPTAKNGIVRDHYKQLGFQQVSPAHESGTVWRLPLDGYTPRSVFMEIVGTRSPLQGVL
jgi:FkbH-like protein